jgi:GTP pyrophosphokinase
MITLPELLAKIRQYRPNFNEALVKKAYLISKESHGNQKRHSGDLYFSHPLAVAEILTNLKLDEESIACGLLHDVVEDTEISLQEIRHEFGDVVASLVDGVTKLGRIEGASYNENFAEDFRKLTLAMSQDIRTLLVKLADRLHNMRTISYMPNHEKKIRKAKETLDIYAPLAGRIGLNQIKDELQELSFAIINPEARIQIINHLEEIRAQKQNLIDQILFDLNRIFAEEKLQCEIIGREKRPYAIWTKMKKQNIGFHNIYDIMAFRVIVKNMHECYRALGIINLTYSMIPGSFKDYISTPKENGYQSLHLAILGPFNKKIEIQIRDQNMNKVAEAGIAAHWHYKENFSSKHKAKVTKAFEGENKYGWIRELITVFENSENASEALLEHKFSLQNDAVFCFTPNGDIYNLPFGSSVVDFAYALHSEIGHRCVSAKVNGVIAPLRHKIENGDSIEIITDLLSKPSSSWLQFVHTTKAKSAIKAFIRTEKFSEYKTLGRAILTKFFEAKGFQLSDEILQKHLNKFSRKSVDALFVAIAEGKILRQDVLNVVYPEIGEKKSTKIQIVEAKAKMQNSVPIGGPISGMAIDYASCCNPIFGDKIIGILSVGSGVIIHNQDCQVAKNIVPNKSRIIDVCWKVDKNNIAQLYRGKILISFANKSGSLASATNIIAQNNINIVSLKTTNRSQDVFEILVDVEVENIEHLEDVISDLKISGKVLEARRILI